MTREPCPICGHNESVEYRGMADGVESLECIVCGAGGSRQAKAVWGPSVLVGIMPLLRVIDRERPQTIDPRIACGALYHKQALEHLASTGLDLFTECEDHDQLPCNECDGVHCHRSCDEIRRTSCRRQFKMRVTR